MQTHNRVWAEVINTNCKYLISNDGLIKRVAYSRMLGNNLIHHKENILKPQFNKGGYLIVGLFINGRRYSKKIHRLVAEAFIPNTENKYAVNHINGCKSDNNVSNLEWVNKSENEKHAYSFLGKKSPSINLKHGKSPKAKKVYQYDLNNSFIKEWSCAREASDKEGFCYKAISGNARGVTQTHAGFIWSFSPPG